MNKNRTEPRISTYLNAKAAKLGIPLTGNFELTARCNFHCPMCYVHLTDAQVEARGRELTAGQWLAVAQQAKEKGMVFALLTGGEPLVRKDFFEIYRGMKAMGLMVSINSNGSMISGPILGEFLKDPPLRFNISLYGGCRQTYETMCGQNAFDRVVENIRTLRKAGIDVSLNVSITAHNAGDLEKINALAKELDVHVRATSYMYPPVRIDGVYGGGERLAPEDAAEASVQWQSLWYTEEEFAKRAEYLKAMVPLEAPDCMVEMEEGSACRAGHSSFWMTWDGKMLPCGMFPSGGAYPLEIGFDAAWQQIRQQTDQIRLPAKCSGCAKKPICPVCPAVCVTETGSFSGVPEYLCRHTDATIEKTWEKHLARKEQNNGN